MIVPYKQQPARPSLALVALDGSEALREDGRSGSWEELLGDRGWRVYMRTETAEELLAAGRGAVVYWNAQPIRWLLSPEPEQSRRSAIVLGVRLPLYRSDAETLADFGLWADWLEREGANAAGSFGGSGLSLVRAKLERPLLTTMGTVPPIAMALGGRQEDAGARPARYRGRLTQHDIQAAYASQLGAVFYGGSWERADWSPGFARNAERQPGRMLYVRARVQVPAMPSWLAPLPCRPRSESQQRLQALLPEHSYPQGRDIQGVWSWQELQEAEASGCRLLRLLDVWVQASAWRPFEPWYEAVLRGRELPGLAGVLAKVTGNSTWGQLAISRGRRLVRWRKPGSRKSTFRRDPLPGGGNPSMRAYDLAEFICGVTRARLHAGMRAVGDDLICAHTDGLWSQGAGVQGWRQREEAEELEILNAQQLRCRQEGRPWRYTVAGVPEREVEAWWAERWARETARGRVREL